MILKITDDLPPNCGRFNLAEISDKLFDRVARAEVDALPTDLRAKVYAQRNAYKRQNGILPDNWEENPSQDVVAIKRGISIADREVEDALEQMRPFQRVYQDALRRRKKLLDQLYGSAWKDFDDGSRGGKAEMERLDTGPAECPAGLG